MWSGTTFSNFSGNIFGGHQKIDRVAFRVLKDVADIKHFPNTGQILFFEGRNGPDGIKSKSPAIDEPWHYIDPFDPSDTKLITMIDGHYNNLVKQLRLKDVEKAAFEASWLSHAIVDGLTPAHHYPYEEKLVELRKGEPIDTRTNVKEKLVMKGDTKSEQAKNNWFMWGFKGLMISHSAFEFGISAIIKPIIFRQVKIDSKLLARIDEIGLEEYYLQTLRSIALLRVYDRFTRFGWTWTLSKTTRDELVPSIIEVVAVYWYMAIHEAGLSNKALK